MLLQEFENLIADNPAKANRHLLAWLSDDAKRAALYREMIGNQFVLAFPSGANANAKSIPSELPVYHQQAYLLVCPDHVNEAFTNSVGFSNAPFLELGSGTFMLALDKGKEHDEQRQFALSYLAYPAKVLNALSTASFMAAAVLPLKTRKFDLADLAEQVALRYMGFLFGFAQADHPVLERTMRQAYRGLNYQMMARHFVSEPGTVLEAGRGMAELLARTTTLIGIYQQAIGKEQEDERKRLQDEHDELADFHVKTAPSEKPLKDFEPVLKRMAHLSQAGGKKDYSTTELGVIAVGLIEGAVGNIQAAICNAVSGLLSQPANVLEEIAEAARKAWQHSPELAGESGLDPYIWEALRLNPPAAFLPRVTTKTLTLGNNPPIQKGRVILLGVGGVTRTQDAKSDQFSVSKPSSAHAMAGGAGQCPFSSKTWGIFGGNVDAPEYFHSCVGQTASMPVVNHAVRQVLMLPGLAESLDPHSGLPVGQKKLWGYGTTRYPLEYKRSELLRQTSLNVFMRVKSPTAVHAEALKAVIKAGAPKIEKVLNEAAHIHFAWFMFLENDAVLNLNTVYDRDFDSYIEHFALKVGPLFDRIFEHIEDAPPMPVNDYPREFIETIRRFNRRPVADYIYSAYPQTEVGQIVQNFARKFPDASIAHARDVGKA